METQNFANLSHYGQLFKLVRINHHSGEVVISWLASTLVDGRVDDFERTNIEVRALLVGEGSVEDHPVNVVQFAGGEAYMCQLGVLVPLLTLGGDCRS